MPGDYNGLTNQFIEDEQKQSGGMGPLHPQLQAIIDKVMGSSMSRAKANALTQLAGDIANTQRIGMGITSAEKLRPMEMANEVERQRIASTPGMLNAETERMTVPGSYGLLRPGKKSTLPSNWYSQPVLGKLFNFD